MSYGKGRLLAGVVLCGTLLLGCSLIVDNKLEQRSATDSGVSDKGHEPDVVVQPPDPGEVEIGVELFLDDPVGPEGLLVAYPSDVVKYSVTVVVGDIFQLGEATVEVVAEHDGREPMQLASRQQVDQQTVLSGSVVAEELFDGVPDLGIYAIVARLLAGGEVVAEGRAELLICSRKNTPNPPDQCPTPGPSLEPCAPQNNDCQACETISPDLPCSCRFGECQSADAACVSFLEIDPFPVVQHQQFKVQLSYGNFPKPLQLSLELHNLAGGFVDGLYKGDPTDVAIIEIDRRGTFLLQAYLRAGDSTLAEACWPIVVE